jgi:hypothetical protein
MNLTARRRRLTPQEKKRRADHQDHRVGVEYPHLHRCSWPKKKALRNRSYRRQLKAVRAPGVPLEDVSPAPVLRRKSTWTRRHGVVPLGRWVRMTLATRLHRTDWNFFKEPFVRERHYARFAAFLATLPEGTSNTSHDLACMFEAVLNGQDPLDQWQGHKFLGRPMGSNPAQWLRAFLQDAPEWEPRLRAWIAGPLDDTRRARRSRMP